MTAPPFKGEIAASFGLKSAMSLAIIGFQLEAMVWFALLDTVERRRAAT